MTGDSGKRTQQTLTLQLIIKQWKSTGDDHGSWRQQSGQRWGQNVTIKSSCHEFCLRLLFIALKIGCNSHENHCPCSLLTAIKRPWQRRCLETNVGNVPFAVAMLLGLVSTLKLSHPKELKNTFEVLQKIIMELDGNKLSNKVQVLKTLLSCF